jgi:hypothetical protein
VAATAEALRRLQVEVKTFEPADWFAELAGLVQTVDEFLAAGQALADPVADQWMAVELPLRLALRWPAFRETRKLEAQARKSFEQGLSHWLSDEGSLAPEFASRHAALFDLWTRVWQLGTQAEGSREWSKSTREKYAGFVRGTVDRLRGDFRVAFSEPEDMALARMSLLAAAEALPDETDLLNAMAWLWPKRTLPTGLPEIEPPEIPDDGESDKEPSALDEDSQAAVLRTGWDAKQVALAVRWDRDELGLDLWQGSRGWISGSWPVAASLGDKPLTVEGPWETVLWKNDADVSYLELEVALSARCRLQRHLLVSRSEGLVLVGESLLADQPRNAEATQLKLETRLPLQAGVTTQTADKSREIHLNLGDRSGLAVPVTLSEWQSDRSLGWSKATGTHLEMTSRVAGLAPLVHGLFACWAIDLRRSGPGRVVTWRNLTVAEERKTLPAGMAVASRLCLGANNWVLYRALAEAAPRTFLGLHITGQFLFSRFLPTGLPETVLEIE